MQHTNSVTAVRVMKFNKAPETGTELASLKCKKKGLCEHRQNYPWNSFQLSI